MTDKFSFDFDNKNNFILNIKENLRNMIDINNKALQYNTLICTLSKKDLEIQGFLHKNFDSFRIPWDNTLSNSAYRLYPTFYDEDKTKVIFKESCT